MIPIPAPKPAGAPDPRRRSLGHVRRFSPEEIRLAGGGQIMSAPPGGRPVMGLSSREVAALRKALTGIRYPAEKWQLIDHCSPAPGGTPPVGPGAIRWLWALPAARYTSLRQVLRAAARAACGTSRGPDADRAPRRNNLIIDNNNQN